MAFSHFAIVISTIPTAIISHKICDLPDLRQVQRVCAILFLPAQLSWKASILVLSFVFFTLRSSPKNKGALQRALKSLFLNL
jgi:hypothetical protein